MKNDIKTQKSLTIDGSVVKVKTEDKYLGDFLHTGGLAKSVEVTVNKRYGVCLNEVLELKAVLEDFRMQSLVGLKLEWKSLIFHEVCSQCPKLNPNGSSELGFWVPFNEIEGVPEKTDVCALSG